MIVTEKRVSSNLEEELIMSYSFNLSDLEKKLSHNYAVMQNKKAAQAVCNFEIESYDDSLDLVSVEAMTRAYKKALMGRAFNFTTR